jgi:octaprenyl-diphosphate synthase
MPAVLTRPSPTANPTWRDFFPTEESSYAAMAADTAREREAQEWCAAPLVEFPHNASLIHDDIEDNSDERRGKPAVHLIYGNDAAINSGAFLYFLPLACIESWEAGAEEKNRVWALWAEHMRRLHLGQAMDISWHRDFSSLPSIAEYETMCRLKTGCLARFAALLGVEAALYGPRAPSGTAEIAAAMEKFGSAAENLGVGFQILDDVKNLTTGIPGKKRGDDVVEGKKSLPVLLYLHAPLAAEAARRAEFTSRCFNAARKGGVAVPQVEEFIAALLGAGVLEEAEKRGEKLIAEAREAFEGHKLLAGFTELLR